MSKLTDENLAEKVTEALAKDETLVQAVKTALNNNLQDAIEQAKTAIKESVKSLFDNVQGTIDDKIKKVTKKTIAEEAEQSVKKILEPLIADLQSELEERFSSLMAVMALGVSLYPGAKVIPTAETLEYCHKHGEKYVPHTGPTKRYNEAVAPLAVILAIENGEVTTYYEIPDSTGKIFRVPSSKLAYKPPTD